MTPRDHTRLLGELAEAYARYSPRSAELNNRAIRCMVDGGSHGLRLLEPFPPRIVRASGAWVEDEDSHRVLDFWQGHWSNILGHNPEIITSSLRQAFGGGFGLETGHADALQIETAELLCMRTGADQVRFTTSGTLATMYAIMLARAYTGRDLVLKVGGGWHGGHPWGLKGIHAGPGGSFQTVESAGIPSAMTDEVVITRFNDPDFLRDQFRNIGDKLACFIVEPCMGVGGGMPGTRTYLQTARELTHRYGSVLVFDEVISGFRFRAGDAGSLVGVRPDLAAFGKAMSGGTPVAAVAGRADILALSGRSADKRVGFSGGTYSAHPACMLAAKTMMMYLIEHEREIYPRLSELGDKARRLVEATFAAEGIYAQCAGYGNDALPPSSLTRVHFPYREGQQIGRPEDALDPSVCDVALSEKVLRLAMLLEDVYVMNGLGSFSTAHTNEDLVVFGAALERVAHRIGRAIKQGTFHSSI
ncbi:MAG TPA: aminotransferase class III-fold pyridoxal phosphate-dependent enzyme [Acidobacteriota bacterium]|nr:aminotransferase class III-fold pyridoxal phosphate-dependent enzyme [Acidobacteriota bacterium]